MYKKLLLICFFSLLTLAALAQHERLDQIADSITNEGKALYRSEWTSWYGTDAFVANCPTKKPLSGGYFSYETTDNLVNVFFSRGDDPVVIASITFGKDFNSASYRIDTAERKFTQTERQYYELRVATTRRMKSDTIFKTYKNTNLNIVPIIQKDVKKVYVLCGPDVDSLVVFGNDYLLNVNSANEVSSVKMLHKNILPMYLKSDSGKIIEASYHNHLSPTSEFMTATDICTLMLYEKFTTWGTNYVISKDYVSIWDCKRNQLVILTMKAWKKIGAKAASMSKD